MTKPKLIVVGGGYGGVALAKQLDHAFDLTLIERKERFFHNVGALRAVVQPEWVQQLSIPYHHLLKHGRILKDTVKETQAKRLFLESGETLDFDYLVLATGSSYPFPAHTPYDDVNRTRESYQLLNLRLEQAKTVAIVGGGPVGVELAGEIVSQYPNKHVTLIHSGDWLIGEPYSSRLGKRLQTQLEALGVTLLFDQRVLNIPHVTYAPPYVLETTKGYVSADLVFSCFGAKPNTQYLRPYLSRVLDPKDRVKVNPHLQVIGYPYMFAIGDITDIIEPKLTLTAQAHANVVAHNLKALVAKRDTLKRYTPMRRPIGLIPLGPKGGAGQLPFGVVGPLFARIKGGDLLVRQYWKILNTTRSSATAQTALTPPVEEKVV